MGRYVFRLPDVGEGVAEAEIAAWHVRAGDRIKEDQMLVDVMTDKATVEITSPVSGVVLGTRGNEGDRVAVGSVLVELDVEGAGNVDGAATAPQQDLPTAPQNSAPRTSPEPEEPSRPAAREPVQAPPPSPRDSVPLLHSAPTACAPLAAPATRARAFALGIPLQFVRGTGPGGRIRRQDLEAYIADGTAKRAPASDRSSGGQTQVHETKVIGLRRLIAQRMQESKRRIPHFSYVEELDLTELEGLRKELNDTRSEQQPKLTLLPFFMQAIVRLQPDFPAVNSTYDDEAGILRSYESVHIGIATQTAAGLMVPVVRNAHELDLWSAASEVARVTKAARDGKATREELSGSTITLTSLGALGGIAATPVINAPEVAIIGPNKLVDRPVVRDGHVVVRTMMNLSSSFDHRIIDGYDAARFVQAFKRLIERPALLFTRP